MILKRIMAYSSERSFPVHAKDYELYEEVGEGVSATVYRALCIPLNVPVAVKVLDLEKCNNDSVLTNIRREVQTMCSIDHPNVLRSYCSFANDHKLWVVMPYMAGGSCLHIMKSTHPDGFEEPVIATLLYEVLKALAYLHAHGYIHRDVKAGNILIDTNGSVKLGDFGVSACMFDTGDRQRSRNTFVGTPCWMAPEVMQQLHGYNFKADIWSFGITALELARGHAPFSKYPPMKVLLMTLQNAPPGLDYKTDKRFSKYFRSLVAACLVKDPKKRPSSEKLLKHRFFQKARTMEYIAKHIIHGLPSLGDRFNIIKAQEAELLVQNNPIVDDKEKLSQQEYMRGISGWNFNLEDLKHEALSQDYEDPELYCKQKDGYEEKPALERIDSRHEDQSIERSGSDYMSEELKSDACAEDANATSPKRKDAQSELEPHCVLQLNSRNVNDSTKKNDDDNLPRSSSTPNNVNFGEPERTLNSLSPEYLVPPCRKVNGNDDSVQPRQQLERNCSGRLCSQMGSNSITYVGDISEGTVIRRKGRFQVMSEEHSPKGNPHTTVNPGCESSANSITSTISATSVLPLLQSILQLNDIQKDEIDKVIKTVEGTFDPSETGTGDQSQTSPGSVREKELQALVARLQQSNEDLSKDLEKLKIENAQLESQINELSNKESERCLKESDD